MTGTDRALGEQLHAIIEASAPGLLPRTWYGMPAYADKDGKLSKEELLSAEQVFRKYDQNDDEIITAVSFPIPAKAAYSKMRHPASRFALTGVFVVKTKSGDVRVAATGASQNGVMRVPAIEAALKANWSPDALDSVKISADGLLTDIHGSSAYRANLIKVMAQRAVTEAG